MEASAPPLVRSLYPYSRPILPLSKRESREGATIGKLHFATTSSGKALRAQNLAMLVDDLIDHPVFLGLLRVHDVIALDVFLDAFRRLPSMLREQ